MEEGRSQTPPSASDADIRNAAVDRFFALVAKTTPRQLERALLPLIEQNPAFWEAVSARLSERLALLSRELAESGTLYEPASAAHVDVVLALLASRLSRSCEEQFNYPGRADDIRRIEQWAFYRALIEVQYLDLSKVGVASKSLARDAVACLSSIFVLLECHQTVPRFRKRIIRQVEDIIIQTTTNLRTKALDRLPMADLDEGSAPDYNAKSSPRTTLLGDPNVCAAGSLNRVERTGTLDSKSHLQVSRRARIDDYKASVKVRTGRRPTDSELAKAANPDWNDRTQINWYKFASPRQSKGAVDMIEKLLREKPHLRR